MNAPIDGDVSTSDDLTGSGAIAGTVAYLSPEVLRGARPDPSLDVWSLCVVLYEAIAGKNPLRGDSPQESVTRILEQEVGDIRETAPSCSPALAAFFHEALAWDTRRRPGSARVLARRLRALLEPPTG